MQPLKLTLVNPPPLAIIEPCYDEPNWGRIALAYLAAFLRENSDVEISIIDAKLERLNFQQERDRVCEDKPDVAGLTAFTNEIKPAAYQAALINERAPSTLTVIGGVHITALPKQTLAELRSFDIGVIGEGEVTLLELCRTVCSQSDLHDVLGLVHRRAGEIVQTGMKPRILDQDTIPHPAWDLFPQTAEYWVQTLRGCPFNCVFCMNHNGRAARTRSVENVIEELELLIDRHDATEIRFGDELFSVDMDRTHRLMDAMIERGIHRRLRWDCQTHVRFVDTPLLAKMKQAGCYRVEMGIETGDESMLRTLGKGTDMASILDAAKAARKAKIPFGTFFILGQPHETPASIRKTVALAIKMNPDLPIIGVMCPYPGTEVARLAAAGEGGYRLLTTDRDEYNKQIGGAMEFSNLTRSQIEWIQIFAYTKVFLYNFLFFSFAKFVWEFRQGAINVVWKAMSRKSSMRTTHSKPNHYDEELQSGHGATTQDIVTTRHEWDEVQRTEMIRAKQEARHLLNVVSRRRSDTWRQRPDGWVSIVTLATETPVVRRI